MKRNVDLTSVHNISRSIKMLEPSGHFESEHLRRIEKNFLRQLSIPDLDERVYQPGSFFSEFENALGWALAKAFSKNENSSDRAALFAHRILYAINRLRLFWFDDLNSYCNEDSIYLQAIRQMIEQFWQDWEERQVSSALQGISSQNAREVLLDWCAQDCVAGELTPDSDFIANRCSLENYDMLLKIGSIDALVEASHLSRMLGGASSEIQMVLMKLLIEEYGAGRLSRKHSTYFSRMMLERGLSIVPEAYLDLCPWERLAGINQEFYFSENKRYFLRGMGSLLYTEVSTPVGFAPLLKASQRLEINMSDNYWALHIQEDIRHAKWMIEGVTIPLLEMYPGRALEMAQGYVQQKITGERMNKAIMKKMRRS